MRDDGLYYEACYHSDPEVVRPVVIQAFATDAEAEAFALAETKRRRARAAIEAMREPTEAMVNAGYDWQVSEWPEDWSDNGTTPELYTARMIWPAMIAAALEQP